MKRLARVSALLASTMGAGTDFNHLIRWSAGSPGIYAPYENDNFYSAIHGTLSVFFADPIDLYFYGGTIVVLLSDSLLVDTAITCPVILSGELMTWPRVSFAAVAIIALAFAAIARIASVRVKVPILLCAAYPGRQRRVPGVGRRG
jgi:hypothetical protein